MDIMVFFIKLMTCFSFRKLSYIEAKLVNELCFREILSM